MSDLIAIIQNLTPSQSLFQLPELGTWTYLLLAVLVAVEGPIATLLGAAAASAGFMRPIPVFFAASAGNLTADSLWYLMGYMGRIEWLFRFGRRLGIRRDMLERLEVGMLEHTTKFLFLAKLTVSFVIPSLVAAGLVKAPWRRWFPAVFGAEIIWTGSLVVIGYYTTEAMKRVERGIEYAVLTGSIVFVALLLFWGRRWLKKRSRQNTELDLDSGQ